jgi:hypothetical protein
MWGNLATFSPLTSPPEGSRSIHIGTMVSHGAIEVHSKNIDGVIVMHIDVLTISYVTTLRVNSGCNKRQRLEGDKAKSKLVKHKEYRVLLCYL